MPKKIPPEAMLSAMTNATVEALRDIEKLYVSKFHEDATSAIGEGAVLLMISSVANDKDGDGFRYLIGLRRGAKVTPHLTCFFGGH
jgi:hypothetical protein